MPIQILPPRLANQIAAGEVVERPASVVKELVENSIDAGATQIHIDIERGGHKRIVIRDNGSGIPKDELTLALSRHATSKITTLDDLEQILSLGFRGEALASISSVARLTLTSKPADQSEAWQAHTEGRDMEVMLTPAAHPDGTSVQVDDLFFNTPARRKFLRSEKTEFAHIDEIIRRIALSRIDVALTLKHNGKHIRRYPLSTSDTPELARISSVCGKAFADSALVIRSEYGDLQLRGWVEPPSADTRSTDFQYFYVNGRAMRDKLVNHAIRQAFEQVLGDERYPAYVVYLTLDPHDVDVNVHPAKHEVRFHQGRQVHDFIVSALRRVLDEQTAPETPQYSHDYIQPLQGVQGPSASYSGSDSAAVEPRRPVHTASGHYTGTHGRGAVSQQSASTYQQLMQAPDVEALQVLSVTNSLWLIACDSTCYLAPVSTLNSARLLHQRRCEQCLTQPLLMPVALSGDRPFCQRAEKLSQWLAPFAVGIDVVGNKVILKTVPSGQRELNWSQIMAQLLATEAANASEAEDILMAALTAQHLSAPQKHLLLQWLLSEPADHQRQLLDSCGKVITEESWDHWYAQA